MKFGPLALITFQILELLCYLVLYRSVSEHRRQMEQDEVISRDQLRARKRIHLFSLYAQVAGFVVEVFYLLAVSFIRIVSQRYFSAHSRELVNSFRITQFGVTSTLQILVSGGLREKLFAIFGIGNN